jgi:hypothetical protein
VTAVRLLADGNEFTEHLFEEICLLTGRARYIYSSLTHDRDVGMVEFAIERQCVRQLQKRLFGIVVSAKYDASTPVRTRLEVRNVEAVTIRDDTGGAYSRLIIERGIFVSRSGIYFSSLEARRGKPLFSLRLGVSGLQLAITDET